MVLSRTLNKLICRVLIGAFLFAQLAVAAYSCPRLGPAAKQVVAVQAAAAEAAMQSGCDQMDRMGQMDPKASNLCAEHCKHGQQLNDTASVPLLFTPSLALLYLLPAQDFGDIRASSSTPAPDPLLAATPPPHAILHCVLRI